MNEGEHLLHRSTNLLYSPRPHTLPSSPGVPQGSAAGARGTADRG